MTAGSEFAVEGFVSRVGPSKLLYAFLSSGGECGINSKCMKIPTLAGIIRRRILVNFRANPEAVRRQLPSCFRPKLHNGYAVAGICLIRLENIRPKSAPEFIGLSSENAAHRIAVRWNDENGAEREGVFIPRRDTNSLTNHLLGGRIFPGEHNRASFAVEQSDTEIKFSMKSLDEKVVVDFQGEISQNLPEASIFSNLAEASSFFETGSLGYSVTKNQNRLDGLTLETKQWRVEAFDLSRVYSSYFADEEIFPAQSAEFDHALIMRNIEHEWHGAPQLYSSPRV